MIVTLGNEPTPALLVLPQIGQLEQEIGRIQEAILQITRPGESLPFPFTPAPVNFNFITPPGRFPLARFDITPAEAFAGIQTLLKRNEDRKVTVSSTVKVVAVAESVEPELPVAVQRVLLSAAFPQLGLEAGFYPYATPVRPVPSELNEIIRSTYENFYTENHTDPGVVILNFANRLPTRRDVMAMIAPQTFNTKLYVRFVVYEGADEKKVRELADWARSILDVNGNPISDRFDIVIAPEDKAAKFIGNIHLLRRPGRDEKTLFELLKNASPVIKNQTDYFAHAVYYADQPLLREMTSLPKAAWRVFYPVARRRFIRDLPYTAVKLARAALTREQLPDADKREFRLQPKTDLFRFVPGELSQLLSAFAANMRRLLAAA